MTETAPVPKGDPLSVAPAPPIDLGLDARPVPDGLLALLDRLPAIVRDGGDAIAPVGLDSVGTGGQPTRRTLRRRLLLRRGRPGRVSHYLGDIDWAEASAPIGWSLAHTHDGRKVLFADGLFAE